MHMLQKKKKKNNPESTLHARLIGLVDVLGPHLFEEGRTGSDAQPETELGLACVHLKKVESG